MNASQNALSLISEFEGFCAAPYRDIAGIPTIGFGFTHYADERAVTMHDPAMSRQDAEALLGVLASAVAVKVLGLVTVPLTQNQLDALVSFAYNLGVGSLDKSTLLKLLNAHDYEGAALEFLKWCHAGTVEVAGLLRRRQAEQKMFVGQ